MKRAEDTSGQEKRYIGLDVHKHYITVGGMNARQELVLRQRNVEMERFPRWAEENLRRRMKWCWKRPRTPGTFMTHRSAGGAGGRCQSG